jgi:hypothetical protein
MNAHSDLKQLNRSESSKAHQKPVPITALVLVPKQGKALFADSFLAPSNAQKRRRIWA